MPTVDELRTVLSSGERFAGDPDTVLRRVEQRKATTRVGHRRRRIGYGLAAAAVVAIAVATPVLLRSPDGTSRSNGGVHIHLAAFSVDTNPNGTIALQTNQGAAVDPDALRNALAQAGVPAVVTVGTICTAPGPRAPEPALNKVITNPPGARISTIVPSAIPAGKKLDISILKTTSATTDGTAVSVPMWIYDLVPDNVPLTCSSTPPANGAYGTPVTAAPNQH
jgi:hypothetical protein